MLTALNKRLLAGWLVLSVITVIYLWIDHSADDHGAPTASTAVTVSAIILALVKVRIIIREFMEVRHAPRLLRGLTDLWVVLMTAVLLGTYFVGKAVAG
ncbi:Cytochrome C oxidase subunit IV [Frankia sp. EI5c]|uniref:cytochrome C oxidase subunit IV family protein n=1 Tax=Frankia sp. EI5c TaxID=683316 RepID=UPI0007C3B681|nr:cytochrome C oxidase subunit IV family protein [Frankia sp. EI5c]OAA27887.1 Cytochrome C oxidase subunit IV [Frankia sp. EI5c]